MNDFRRNAQFAVQSVGVRGAAEWQREPGCQRLYAQQVRTQRVSETLCGLGVKALRGTEGTEKC